MHVYGITKNGTDEPIFRAELETQIQILDAAGEGQGGTNWESSIETYTLSYVK